MRQQKQPPTYCAFSVCLNECAAASAAGDRPGFPLRVRAPHRGVRFVPNPRFIGLILVLPQGATPLGGAARARLQRAKPLPLIPVGIVPSWTTTAGFAPFQSGPADDLGSVDERSFESASAWFWCFRSISFPEILAATQRQLGYGYRCLVRDRKARAYVNLAQ